MGPIEIKRMLQNGEINTVIELQKKSPSFGPAVLAAVLMIADEAKQKYLDLGIDESVFNNTMADIAVWAENYHLKTGFCGVEELGWLYNHWTLQLFALGRLQFRMSKFYRNANLTYARDCSIEDGTDVLEVHIPQGKRLSDDECDRSFCHAQIFFDKIKPDTDFKYYTCHSWLLSPILKEILPEDSNIIKFQNRFTIIALDPNDNDAERRILDKRFGGNAESDLAQKVKHLSQKGIKIGAAIGIIKISDKEDKQ